MDSNLQNDEAAERRREQEVFNFASWQHPVQRLAMQSNQLCTWGLEPAITCTLMDLVDLKQRPQAREAFFDLSSSPSYTVLQYYCLLCQVVFDAWAIHCPNCGTRIRRP